MIERIEDLNPDAPSKRLDQMFDLLSSSRRRFVLRYLRDADVGAGPVERSELATELAAHELGIDPEDVGSEARKRALVALYQTHLPKLAATGAVDYDPRGGLVWEGWAARSLYPYLGAGAESADAAEERGRTWFAALDFLRAIGRHAADAGDR